MDVDTVLGAVIALPPAVLVAYGTARHVRAKVRRRDGFATGGQLARHLSERAARRHGRLARPGLDDPLAAEATEFGRRLGRAVRPEGGRMLWARHEDVVGIVAPPRAGKTAKLGSDVIDAPGPVVVTSTKVDIHQLTAPLRARRGPVWVLNPEGMAGLASTFRWSPIPACADPAVAIVTAAHMVGGAHTGTGTGTADDRSFWENQNAKVLRSLLHAAAVGGKSMRDVARWVADPNDPEPLDLLEDASAPAGWVEVLRQIMLTPAEKTRESVYLTLQLVLEFMADPHVAQSVLPEPHDSAEDSAGGAGAFDVEAFLTGGGTLYLLGAAKEYGGMGPIFAALTGVIFETAKRLSQDGPTGRLDPPLSLILDEATGICPVPLPRWTSDAGGRGIHVVYAVQSFSQLEERWGREGRETIWQNTNAKLILGGLAVPGDLQDLSAMLGERDELTPVPYDPRAHRQAPIVRRVPVLTPDQIRGLPEGHALLLYRHLRPVLLTIRPVWRRRDVRRARADLDAARAEETLPPPQPRVVPAAGLTGRTNGDSSGPVSPPWGATPPADGRRPDPRSYASFTRPGDYRPTPVRGRVVDAPPDQPDPAAEGGPRRSRTSRRRRGRP